MTELDRRVEELARRQHGVFSTRQVLLLNGNERMIQTRIRSGRWLRDAPGVLRLLGAPFTASARPALLDRQADARRDARATAAGSGVLHFGWTQVVGRPEAVITEIRAVLDATLRS